MKAIDLTSFDSNLSSHEVKLFAELGYSDPVFFCTHFLEHLFPSPMPWFHRAILAILTKQTRFLLAPLDARQDEPMEPELARIMRNFVVKDEDLWRRERELKIIRPIFRVFEGDGTELTADDVQALEDASGHLGGQGLTIRMTLGRFSLFLLPRGFSKSTLAGIALPIRRICYRESKFFAYISETGPHAKMQVLNVKSELESSQRLREVFGEFKQKELKWTEEFFETASGVAMTARGRGSQVRGLNFKGNRPDQIIVDDLEDKESVETEHQRKKTRTWFYGDLKPALPKPLLNPEASITMLGTMLHEHCLLETLRHDPEWTYVNIAARDLAGDEIWPEAMPREALEREKQSAQLAGELSTFYLEYFNEPRDDATTLFKKEHFIYGSLQEDEHIEAKSIYCDPAWAVGGDDCVLGVVGISNLGRYHVLEAEGGDGWSPTKTIDLYFELHKQHAVQVAGVESNAFQGALLNLMRERCFRDKYYFEPIGVPTTTRKSERIKGTLYPRFAIGAIIFHKRWPKLEVQLLDYKVDVKDQPDDWPDWLAGCIKLLDEYTGHAAPVSPYEDQFEPLNESFGRMF